MATYLYHAKSGDFYLFTPILAKRKDVEVIEADDLDAAREIIAARSADSEVKIAEREAMLAAEKADAAEKAAAAAEAKKQAAAEKAAKVEAEKAAKAEARSKAAAARAGKGKGGKNAAPAAPAASPAPAGEAKGVDALFDQQ